MTDARDETSDVVPERGEGRRQRVGDSGSPVGSTLSIILAVVAVIAGFLILRALTSDDDSSSDEGNTITPVETAATTPSTGTSDTGTVGSDVGSSSTTTPMVETKTGATIVVANASGIGGSAGQMSTALMTDGYMTVAEPGNSTGDPIPASIVYYAPNDPAALAVAQTLAADLGGVQTAEIVDPRPAEGGAVAEATVLVMLGQDAAGRTLAELAGGAAAGETTVPGGGVVPPPEIVTSTSGG
ncbi:MAG: LytR C-terminal domain-containing protein [Ilumatobacteraceae bacterium]